MAKLRLLCRDACTTAVATASPAMSTSLPVTNLQRPIERERVARTTSLASQDIKLAWASAQKANAIVLARHNLTTAATLRTLLYSDVAWTTGIYDSTALTAFSLSGLNTDIAVYTERDFRMFKTTVQYFTEVTTMQSAIARIADAANPDGVFDVTKLMIGKYTEVSINPPYGGVDLTFMDKSVQGDADDGTMIVDKRWKARKLVIELDQIVDSSDLDEMFAIAHYAGTDKEIFVSVYPEVGGAKEFYHHFVGRLIDSPTFNPHQVGLHKGSFVFRES